ncbi:MAG: LSM domain-containing protein [Candidatus Njordarchaeia archaeon]
MISQGLRPKDIIAASLDKAIIVKLKGSKMVRGILASFDQHLNLFLNNAGEIKEDGSFSKLGNIIVRGDNVILLIFPSDKGE